MRAITRDRYGTPDVLRIEDVPVPAVHGDRVRIRVRASSVNRSDWESLTGSPAYVRLSGSGLRRPKASRLGSDVAGVVEDVGPDVTRFDVGDEVFGDILWHGTGAFADQVMISERAPLAPKPPSLSFEAAAALPQAAVLALQGLRGVEAGQRVVVNGGGGGAGTFAVQMAKNLGAHVTAVDNGHKQDLMRSLGADEVVDYTSSTYTGSAEPYDRILDFAAGRSILANRRVLADGGSYRLVGGSVPKLLGAFVAGGIMSRFGSRSLGVLMAKPTVADLVEVAELVVTGAVTPSVGNRFELEGVAEALELLGSGRLRGKAVISVS